MERFAGDAPERNKRKDPLRNKNGELTRARYQAGLSTGEEIIQNPFMRKRNGLKSAEWAPGLFQSSPKRTSLDQIKMVRIQHFSLEKILSTRVSTEAHGPVPPTLLRKELRRNLPRCRNKRGNIMGGESARGGGGSLQGGLHGGEKLEAGLVCFKRAGKSFFP